MIETEKIEVAQEESEIVEGYNHLTNEDFLSEPETPEEAKEEVKEVEVKAEESETETPESIPEDSSNGETYEINGTTYTKDDLETRMIRDYKNLVSHTGKQAERIGEYKSQISELETNIEKAKQVSTEENSEINYDNYDIYSPQGIAKLAEDMADKKLKAQQEKIQTTEVENNFNSNVEDAKKKFLENHPTFSDDDMIDLVSYGQDQGLILGKVANADQVHSYLENVYSQKTGDFGFFTNQKSTGNEATKVNQVVEKVREGQKVKAGLANVNSSEDDVTDYDALNESDWEKLPVEKRNELLGI